MNLTNIGATKMKAYAVIAALLILGSIAESESNQQSRQDFYEEQTWQMLQQQRLDQYYRNQERKQQERNEAEQERQRVMEESFKRSFYGRQYNDE